jgi:hypothetical protein
MKQLSRILPFVFAAFLISELVEAQTLYADEESHGILIYSGYSNLEGPASTLIAGLGYSVKKEIDLSFEYSVLNYGISGSGYWNTQPEKTNLYLGTLTLYPLKRQNGQPLTGQISVGSGWMVDSSNDGPVVSLTAALSGKGNLSDELDLYPRISLSYVPVAGRQAVTSLSLGFDFSLSAGISSGISLLINPLLLFDIEEQNMTSGVVVGILL